jgi:hypothetical protein
VFESNGIDPKRIRLVRRSGGSLDVIYSGMGPVGSACFQERPCKYAVMKAGTSRAYRVLNSYGEALSLASEKGYTVETRGGGKFCYMSYYHGKYSHDPINVDSTSVDDFFPHISKWCSYVKKSLKELYRGTP